MKILFHISLVLFLFSCNELAEQDSNVDENKNSLKNKNEKMEAIYYSIPSPMETTIILKKTYSKFSSQLLFPKFNY